MENGCKWEKIVIWVVFVVFLVVCLVRCWNILTSKSCVRLLLTAKIVLARNRCTFSCYVRTSWTKYPIHVEGLFFIYGCIADLVRPDRGTLSLAQSHTWQFAIWQVQFMFCSPLFAGFASFAKTQLGWQDWRVSLKSSPMLYCLTLTHRNKGQNHLLHITTPSRRVQKKSPPPSFEYSNDGGERIGMFTST